MKKALQINITEIMFIEYSSSLTLPCLGTTVGDSYIGQFRRIELLSFLLCTESLDSKFACEQFQIVSETCSTTSWTHRCGLVVTPSSMKSDTDTYEFLSGNVDTAGVVPKVYEVFEMQSTCS